MASTSQVSWSFGDSPWNSRIESCRPRNKADHPPASCKANSGVELQRFHPPETQRGRMYSLLAWSWEDVHPRKYGIIIYINYYVLFGFEWNNDPFPHVVKFQHPTVAQPPLWFSLQSEYCLLNAFSLTLRRKTTRDSTVAWLSSDTPQETEANL